MKITKFRVWDKANNKMEVFLFKEMCFKGIWDLFPNIQNFDPESLMQFTGLQDKNGKDIYEGDNIEFEFYNEIRKETVIYGNGSFTLGYCMSLWDTEQDRFKSVKLEIIGNIHENPELTK